MPIYEYECKKCFLRFELKKQFGKDGRAGWPLCQGDGRRIFSPVSIVFKGSGFYMTDSRNNRPQGSEKYDKIEVGKKLDEN